MENEEQLEDSKDKCDSCRLVCSGKVNELHTCPYKEDIYGDYETLCNCCDECTQECVWDI